jgi:hypothetical protein
MNNTINGRKLNQCPSCLTMKWIAKGHTICARCYAEKKVKEDKPIGKAKRDIKAGELVQFNLSGNKVTSPDIALNKRGKAHICNKVDDYLMGGGAITFGRAKKEEHGKI